MRCEECGRKLGFLMYCRNCDSSLAISATLIALGFAMFCAWVFTL